MTQEWWTPREAADARLPGLPTTQQGFSVMAETEGWNADPARCRKRGGRGGGREYHYTLFPAEARAELARRGAAEAARNVRLPAIITVAPTVPARTGVVTKFSPKLIAAGLDRQDAKLTLLAAFDAFFAVKAGMMSKDAAVHLFAGHWSAGQIEAPAWVREVHPRVSPRSLWRWIKDRADCAPEKLAGRYGGRAGSGKWDNEFAMIRDQVIQLKCAQPHFTVTQLRDAMVARFCDAGSDGQLVAVTSGNVRRLLAIPSPGEFQRMLREWEQSHISLFRSFHDADGYNNKDRLRLGSHSHGIVALNQLWMIDASPQDMLLTEGRHSLYLLIDVWSRRVLILVTRTPRTEAMKLLLRRALLEWGVPETLKTDNGSDFVSREALRVFAALGIEHLAATPYAPWEKSFVERAIGTLQHDLYPMLPGYTGHNVAAAQRLRAARPFSDRLGETDREAFEVQLDAKQAQTAVDFWAAEKYGHHAHSGEGMNGMSPVAKVASWGGTVARVPDQRALDLLLIRAEGTRIVRAKGIQFDNNHYYARELLPFLNTGEPLEVRIDPAAPHLAYIWRQDPRAFIATAECLEMMTPEYRAELAVSEQAHQRKQLRDDRAGIRSAGGETDRLSVATEVFGHQMALNRRGQVIALPVKEITHSSPELAAAGRALRAMEPVTPPPVSEAFLERHRAAVERSERGPISRETDTDEWIRRAADIETRLVAGADVSDEETEWLALNKPEPWYRTWKRSVARAREQEAALTA